jgi:hypothetical protein
LACALGCDFAIRFDPGTEPPVDLGKHLDRILAALTCHDADVCSGVYEGRLAVRADLVSKNNKESYYKFIHESTGVTVHDQITGGAMLAQRMPGLPASPFPPFGGDRQPTLVWGSDDGFFQLSHGTRCVVLQDLRVPRFSRDGKLKTPTEYYRGLAGTVCIRALRRNQCNEVSALRDLVWKFVNDLNKYLDVPGPAGTLVPADVAPDEYLQAVRDGWVNYQRLASRWSDITNRVKQHGCALRVLSSIC